MAKIRVKNFGPIRGGLTENDGWMEVTKVTVFIGNQGSGKSTIAKLISTFSWLEKAMVKGEVSKEQYTLNHFKERLAYQNIAEYLIDKEEQRSEIEYRGEALHFHLVNNEISLALDEELLFDSPKIMYVPSDRNLISAVDNIRTLTGLPRTIYTFADEFFKAVDKIEKECILPINAVEFEYDTFTEKAFIKEQDYKLKLSSASSGFQALVPLYIVSSYLSKLVKEVQDKRDLDFFFDSDYFSLNDKKRIQKEIELSFQKRLVRSVTDDVKNRTNTDGNKLDLDDIEIKKIIDLSIIDRLSELTEKTLKKYIYSYFFNIVEEPEQNLYPTSQRNIVNSLVEFANDLPKNKLVLTTHSPYLINYLTLAIKAQQVVSLFEEGDEKLQQVFEIVPAKSLLFGVDVRVYELSEEGSIFRLETYQGMPSDENWLNKELEEFNDLFMDLLEIENKNRHA
ncbi:AAA family ATPase [Myroides sp. DW712]|uniref:AAA family ATPase n=1 Tax=Myroides sp. DW712 TaxID=3389800 RepID=UPI00397AC1E3